MSKSIQDDLLKRRAMMSLFPQHEVITQEDQDERTRYHIPMLDGGTIELAQRIAYSNVLRKKLGWAP